VLRELNAQHYEAEALNTRRKGTDRGSYS